MSGTRSGEILGPYEDPHPLRVTVTPLLSCGRLAALFPTRAAPGFHWAGCKWQVHKVFERCPHSNQAYLRYFWKLNIFILSNPAVPVWSAPKHTTLQGRGMEGVSPLHYSSLLSLAGGTQSLRNHTGPGLAEGSNRFTRRTGGQSSCRGYLQACKLLQGTSIGIPASFNVLSPSRERSLWERFPCWQ